MYKQLSLNLMTEAINKVDNLKNHFNITSYKVFEYDQFGKNFKNLNQLAKYIYENGKWDLKDLLNSVLFLAKYLSFPERKDVTPILMDWTKSPLNDYPHDLKDQLILLKYAKPIDYQYFLIVKETESSDNHGGMRKLNENGKADNIRFVVQSAFEVIGYSKIIQDISHFCKKNEDFDINQSTLKSHLKKIIDSNYNFQKSSKISKSNLDVLLDPWLGSQTQITSRRVANTQIEALLSEYLRLISNLSWQANLEDKLIQVSLSRNQLRKLKKVKHKLYDFFKEIYVNGEIDRDLFARFQENLLKYLPMLPRGKNKPVLELANLRDKNIFGLYLPKENKIVLDFPRKHQLAAFGEAGCRTFLHEYGMYIDYNFTDALLSMKSSFSDILKEYQAYMNKNGAIYNSSIYKAPSEVFTTAFEVYVNHIGMENLLTKKSTDIAYNIRYSVFDKELLEKVITYFNKQFPEIKNSLSFKRDLVIQ